MLKWLRTKTGLKAVIAILAIALILSVVGQIAGGSGIGHYLTGASSLPDREDPLIDYKFGLEVEGRFVGHFASASGMGSESEVVEHKITNETGELITQLTPGRLSWMPITLSRGLTSNLDVWEWRQAVVDGRVDEARTNCSIVVYDAANQEVARWNLENAWPSAVSVPAAEDESTEYIVESITLVHEGMERVK